MKKWKPFIAGAALFCFHFSACTGGMLSSSLALVTAASAQAYQSETEILQSPVLGDQFVCVTISQADPSSDVRKTDTQGGCRDAKTCLTQGHGASVERATAAVNVLQDMILPSCADTQESPSDIHFIELREGPLYEHARQFAASMVKRE